MRRRGPGKVKAQEASQEGNDTRLEPAEPGLRRSFPADGGPVEDEHSVTRQGDADLGNAERGAKRMRTTSPGAGATGRAVSEGKMQEE